MVAIDDINKLRPELLKKSPAELRRQRDEIDLALIEIERQELIKEKVSVAAEINRHIEMALESIKFLKANGRLADRIVEAFSRNGAFNPSSFLKHVTPEDLITTTLTAPRRRRTKAEIEALKASGEYKPRRKRSA